MRHVLKRCEIPALLLALLSMTAAADRPQNLHPRETYNVPLAKLSVSLDEGSNRVKRVRVSYEGTDDYANIGPINDEFVKLTRRGRETTVYREPWEAASHITNFEGEQLYKVVEKIIETLLDFEENLKDEEWAKCHYLDSYLPRFLRGFYFLYDAMVCHQNGLPRVARVPERAFDVSLNSPKTDERIAKWRSRPDHIIKLRIASKELVYQLQRWQKRAKKDPQRLLDNDVKKAHSLFVRIYFVLNPPAKAPQDGEHF
ncbi:MAG: hypothetical protein GF331_00905 [Chitinivibrionales bacterium]|nr:hypothetical protein [Chitinivibrionales bacterium]